MAFNKKNSEWKPPPLLSQRREESRVIPKPFRNNLEGITIELSRSTGAHPFILSVYRLEAETESQDIRYEIPVRQDGTVVKDKIMREEGDGIPKVVSLGTFNREYGELIKSELPTYLRIALGYDSLF